MGRGNNSYISSSSNALEIVLVTLKNKYNIIIIITILRTSIVVVLMVPPTIGQA